nr:MAG TPA: TniQ [Caudoviricetes sp.]
MRFYSTIKIVLQIIWRYCPQCYALRVFVYIVLYCMYY